MIRGNAYAEGVCSPFSVSLILTCQGTNATGTNAINSYSRVSHNTFELRQCIHPGTPLLRGGFRLQLGWRRRSGRHSGTVNVPCSGATGHGPFLRRFAWLFRTRIVHHLRHSAGDEKLLFHPDRPKLMRRRSKSSLQCSTGTIASRTVIFGMRALMSRSCWIL